MIVATCDVVLSFEAQALDRSELTYLFMVIHIRELLLHVFQSALSISLLNVGQN